MLEELHAASNLLSTALERYMDACSALHHTYQHKYDTNSAPELLNSVTNELKLVEDYKDRLTLAHIWIKRARNNPANVPINSLPSEVLTRIFHLVQSQQPCPLRVTNHWSRDNPVIFPKHPDTLSHVCSRWRQIALASHTLWSHIDIALSCPLSRGFHERAKIYAARAYEAPLDIHFIDPGLVRQVERFAMGNINARLAIMHDWSESMHKNNPQDFDFLTSSTMPRINSLGLLVHYAYHLIYSRAMEHCFANCLPGDLTELIVHVPDEAHSIPTFFRTSSDSPSSTEFFLSKQQLEIAWRSVTTLHLKGSYPGWTSTAYHGLTDLRLYGGVRISSSELVNVLKASPGLRVLCCDFEITDLPSLGALIVPVALHELEILDLRQMAEASVGRFLRWLNPGSKPLQLSFRGSPTSALLKDFFTRSNVQELRVKGFTNVDESELPPVMFYLPPQLRVLVIANWGWDTLYRGMRIGTVPHQCNGTPPHLELDTLYMLSCHCEDLHNIQEIVKRYSPQRLILWDCQITHPNREFPAPVDLALLRPAIENDLVGHCPLVEFLGSEDPHPLQDWN
ncbi:unnamed protein product [Rhizoctonia solani]|uniref:F-box-like domain protein n=1 Tax=Rhizoctonia solani TaxID=456999 RepID=A0A8H3D339_9AGAM|nr:unnamed protein product [Rhizoctonia solani]